MWNAGRLELVDELVTSAYVIDGVGQGPAAVRQNVATFRSAFPDVHLTVLDLVAEGNRVAVRMRIEGTHRGAFRGIPPTGRRVSYEEMGFWHLANGKLRAGWFVAGALGLRIQLGVLPTTFWHDPQLPERS